jgi:hypothetical protein
MLKVVLTLLALVVAPSLVCAQSEKVAVGSPTGTVELYATIKYRNDPRAGCFNFESGSIVSNGARCDLHYGMLYAGNDFDWFNSSATAGNRSVIRDLGPRLWTSAFELPVVEPFSKLKPGEHRRVMVDASGADGGSGASGATVTTLEPDADDSESRMRDKNLAGDDATPKGDGKSKGDQLFVKAIVGHMYVIHVVDDNSDFYALFTVDAIEKGLRCVISWKIVPAPQRQSASR